MKDFDALKRRRSAFTLIEMLVVIAIIGILAGLILTALAGAKDDAKKKAAQTDIATLMTAIEQYQADYSRLPCRKEAQDAANPDFTFGTRTYAGADVPGLPIGRTNVLNPNGLTAYQESNAEVLSILRADTIYRNAENVAYNPRKILLFNAKINTQNQAGIGSDGVFRDPWGQPYIIVLDLNYNSKCVFIDPVSGNTITNSGSVMIWSCGSPNASKTAGHPNGKPIVSWK